MARKTPWQAFVDTVKLCSCAKLLGKKYSNVTELEFL